MPFAHVAINTADLNKTTDFYLKALAPLGYKKLMQPVPHVVGLGTWSGATDFWIATCPEELKRQTGEIVADKVTTGAEEKPVPVTTPVHIAFSTNSRAKVRAFHKAALEAGAKCNGPPGLRPQYFATYYGAFVYDHEGRNIEVVTLMPGLLSENGPFYALVSAVCAVAVGATKYWGLW